MDIFFNKDLNFDSLCCRKLVPCTRLNSLGDRNFELTLNKILLLARVIPVDEIGPVKWTGLDRLCMGTRTHSSSPLCFLSFLSSISVFITCHFQIFQPLSMAAFSFQYHPFLVDSPFFSTAPIKMTPFAEQPQVQPHTNPAPQIHETSLENCFVDQNSKFNMSDNEPSSVTKNQSPETSLVLDKLEPGEQVTQKVTPIGKRRRNRNRSSLSRPQSKEATGERNKRQKKSNNGEAKEGDKQKDEKKSPEEPPTGYIHVRARRGQATDSHSLAERARREKISERMKMLQRLVPGCDKVTGKALMLDEIINYVQSLQNQVEFLSMKLASVNPMLYDFTMDIDSLMVRPVKSNGVAAPLPSVPQCSLNQAITFADTTTTTPTVTATTGFPTANDYPLDIFQGQRSNVLSEDTGSQFWDIEDPRQKFLHPYGINNSLRFFH